MHALVCSFILWCQASEAVAVLGGAQITDPVLRFMVRLRVIVVGLVVVGLVVIVVGLVVVGLVVGLVVVGLVVVGLVV